MKPTKKQLQLLYVVEKHSPEAIGEMFGVSGRTVRTWMKDVGIQRMGPSHLRKGVSAHWNVGLKRSSEQIEKNRAAHVGLTPHNKGKNRCEFTCEVCEKIVIDKPYRRSVVCSIECRNVRNSQMRGESHWNFKGEYAGNVQRKRQWAAYREWRISVIRNANFTCAKCGKVGDRMTAHHKNSWNTHPEQRLVVENGACLCWACHWSFHRKYGHRHSTEAQYEDWITKC